MATVEVDLGPTAATADLTVAGVLATHDRGYAFPVSGDHRPSAEHPHGRPVTLEERAAYERSYPW